MGALGPGLNSNGERKCPSYRAAWARASERSPLFRRRERKSRLSDQVVFRFANIFLCQCSESSKTLRVRRIKSEMQKTAFNHLLLTILSVSNEVEV